MGIIALFIRLLVAATFLVAGIAKLANLEGTRKAIRDFGLPEWAAGFLKIFLPLTELAVCFFLVPVATVLWGSLGATALLLAFTVGISINLLLGRKPECNCFGQLHSKPIGWHTLVRNCVLICCSLFVVWDARRVAPISMIGWANAFSIGERFGIFFGISALVIATVEGWLILHLLRQNGRLVLRIDALELQPIPNGIAAPSAPLGLSVGSKAPDFELPVLDGDSVLTLDALLSQERPVALIFSDPDCGPCSALLPNIAHWQKEHTATLSIAIISRGSQRANRLKIAQHGVKSVGLQKNREVSAAYLANGTPSAVLIGRDGKIASSVVMGSVAIADLIARGAGQRQVAQLATNGNHDGGRLAVPLPVGLKVGDAAPPVLLADLDGNIVELAGFKGKKTLVLFWNPKCGFCAKMLSALKQWEENSVGTVPQLLVISSGTAEENRAMGLRATVLLDKNFATGLAFHVRGTPAAVLVDAEGKIGSEVASGATAVLALASPGRELRLTSASAQV